MQSCAKPLCLENQEELLFNLTKTILDLRRLKSKMNFVKSTLSKFFWPLFLKFLQKLVRLNEDWTRYLSNLSSGVNAGAILPTRVIMHL